MGSQEAYERQKAAFLALVRTTGNPEHALAFETLAERLEPVQLLASLALDEIEEETGDILAALGERDAKGLRHALVRYHRRRMQIPELIERLYCGNGDRNGGC